MSLLLSASPYRSDENVSRKRTATMRKYVKSKVKEDDSPPPLTEGFDNSSHDIDELQTINENRNIRINEILNKMSSDDNDKLGDFKPLEHPILNVKKDLTETDSKTHEYIPNIPSYLNASNAMKSGSFSYQGKPIIDKEYSNYNQSYQSPLLFKKYSNTPNVSSPSQYPQDDKLMEKINYMVHLLEQQHNEKTSNITEEFILYVFLGIFVIYVVDTFTRAGKYIR